LAGERTALLIISSHRSGEKKLSTKTCHSLQIWFVASGRHTSLHAIQERLSLHSYHYWWYADQVCMGCTKAKSGNDVAIAIAKIIQDNVRKICRLTEKKNFTMQTCRNSWRNMISITIRHIP